MKKCSLRMVISIEKLMLYEPMINLMPMNGGRSQSIEKYPVYVMVAVPATSYGLTLPNFFKKTKV